MLQLPYEPFDDDHFDRNFRHSEFTDWRDGILTDRVIPELRRLGVSPSSLGWLTFGGRPRIVPRSILELRLAVRFGMSELVIDGYRHFAGAPLRLGAFYFAEAAPEWLVLGALPRSQGALVSSLSDHEDPDVGFLDHEEGNPRGWYDGLSMVLARCERAAPAPPATPPIGFGTETTSTPRELWPRGSSAALRQQLVRLGAFVPTTELPRAALQLLGSRGAFTVGAVGALRDGDVVHFGPVSDPAAAVAPHLLPIGTVAGEPARYVLLDLDDPHLEDPGLFVTSGTGPAEIGRVSELFAAATAFAS